MKTTHYVLAALATVAAPAVWATEGGGSTYPLGAENFLSAAAPPPGVYVMEYYTHYSADKLKDNDGNNIPLPVFKLQADVAVTRVVWSTPTQVWGGNLIYQAIIPAVLKQKVELPGLTKSTTGLSDIILGAALAHHYSPQLHGVVALELVAPTGDYDQHRAVNAGRNYWAVQPVYTMSYIDPHGFNGDFKAVVDLNQTNHATQYRSGRELNLDYAAGWGIGHGLTVGVSGYYYRQFSDDKMAGVTVRDNRAAATSIGPSLKFDNGHHWFVTAKWAREFDVRNRPQGSSLWLKTILPF